MSDKVEVKTGEGSVLEKRRKIVFKSGAHLNLRNVTDINYMGSYLRITCDEGFVAVNNAEVNYIVVN